MKGDVESPESGLKLIDVQRLINDILLAYFFNRSMLGRDSCRLDLTTSIQEQKYTVYRTLSFLKTGILPVNLA